jgi:hypothetical protein
MALEQRPDIETLAGAIAQSPIVVARAWAQNHVQKCAQRSSRSGLFESFPDGFDDADLAILRWIAEEGRRVGRTLARI